MNTPHPTQQERPQLDAGTLDRIHAFVAYHGDEGVTRTQLLLYMGIKARKLRRYTDALLQAGVITWTTEETGKRGRPTLKWVAVAPYGKAGAR